MLSIPIAGRTACSLRIGQERCHIVVRQIASLGERRRMYGMHLILRHVTNKPPKAVFTLATYAHNAREQSCDAF